MSELDLAKPRVAPSTKPGAGIALSVVIMVAREEPDLAETHLAYKAVMDGLDDCYEFIYVVSSSLDQTRSTLTSLKDADPHLNVLALGGEMGEAEALATGLEQARGKTILTLPAHQQVDPQDIPKVLAALNGSDMAVGRRSDDQQRYRTAPARRDVPLGPESPFWPLGKRSRMPGTGLPS